LLALEGRYLRPVDLLYFPQIRLGEALFPDPDTVRHLKALRVREGEVIWLTDGKGQRYEGRLSGTGKEASIEVLGIEAFTPSVPLLHMAIAPTRHPDRLEWFVEKAVEIGVHCITLITCDHSERTQVRSERLERVAIAALKQSQRYTLPPIYPVTTFRSLIERPFEGQRLIAHCYDEVEKVSLKQALQPGQDALICIGPEGDFSRDEVDLATESGMIGISLGSARLRTETAGLVAVHTFELTNHH